MTASSRKPRVLAVSSGGGHWVQLLRLQKAFEGCDVAFATVLASSRSDIRDSNARFHVLPDATRWNKFRLVWLVFRVAVLLLRERPDVVITTGAAPGYLALVLGRMLGKKTCWIDSIANVEELSMSGQKARRWATLWLTQWPEVATPDGPQFLGNVIGNLPVEDTNGSSGTKDDDPKNPQAPKLVTPFSRGKRERPVILAISSGGGHWVELMRLRPAFAGCDVSFASVHPELAVQVEGSRYHCIPDVTRWSKRRVPWSFLVLLKILMTERPSVVITTGAAPGYLACLASRLVGIRSCWVDSIANADEISMSGVKARRWISLLLTQWPNLAEEDGPQFKGNVL